MSVNFALVPIALALRVIMGKERFQKFVESLQLKIPTTFTDAGDMTATVRAAGYDADRWGGSYKTHVDSKLWFFWELVDGRWTAVFGSADSRQAIFAFIQDVEAKAGRQVFEWAEPGQAPRVLPSQTFPTNFRDPELLRATLREYGLTEVFSRDGHMAWRMDGITLNFKQDLDQPFMLEIRDVTDMRQIYPRLNAINDAYGRQVQTQAYTNLKNRIRDRGLMILSEERTPDEAIVLTLSVN